MDNPNCNHLDHKFDSMVKNRPEKHLLSCDMPSQVTETFLKVGESPGKETNILNPSTIDKMVDYYAKNIVLYSFQVICVMINHGGSLVDPSHKGSVFRTFDVRLKNLLSNHTSCRDFKRHDHHRARKYCNVHSKPGQTLREEMLHITHARDIFIHGDISFKSRNQFCTNTISLVSN